MNVPGTIRFSILISLIAASTVSAQQKTNSQFSAYDRILKKWGIEATNDGLSKYLKNMLPESPARKEARQWLQQLSDNRFEIRRQAANNLSASPYISRKLLEAAAKSSVPELRKRANDILKLRGSTPRLIPSIVFRKIRADRIPVAVPLLLKVIPSLHEQYLHHTIRKTILFVAKPDDATIFVEALSNPHVEVRIAAVQALGKLRLKNSSKKLSVLLASANTSDREKIRIVRTLLNFGERKRIPDLVGLLVSDELQVRIYASMTLTDIAGDSLGYAPFDPVEERRTSFEKWKAWVKNNLDTVELNLPLPPLELGMGHLNGNTLLAFGYKNKIAEYDSEGKEIWQYKIRGAWSAEKLKNGNILLAAYYLDKVLEVDSSGKTVWEYPMPGCLNARKLRNGNVLVVSSSGRKVREIDPKRNVVVWEYLTSANCRDASRLANGNTLVAYGNNLEEITPQGTISWNYVKKTQPFGLHALPNGNILIADFGVSSRLGKLSSGRVIEINRKKEIVWSYSDLQDGRRFRPSDVFRLPNGNTLITTEKRFLEVDPNGVVLWEKYGCHYGSARK